MRRKTPGTYRFGFVFETGLGHGTHYRNMRRAVAEDASINAAWVPLSLEGPAPYCSVPLVKRNFAASASWLGASRVARARFSRRLDLAFYHTQTSALFARMPLLPYVISTDATPINYDSVAEAYDHQVGGTSEGAKFRLYRSTFRSARALVTWCRWARDSLVADYGVPDEKITVIPPGVDLSLWPARTAHVPDDASRLPRLLFVGGDFKRKGGEVLLECFERHFRERVILDIVTKSDITPRQNVRVHRGITPNSPELTRLYVEADIFVFPTLADCAPLAVPEAMAASLPVISTHVAAIPEAVCDGETGFLVPPGDAEALRPILEQLLEHPELRASMGQRGRALVEAEHDARANNQRLLALLKNVADGLPPDAPRESEGTVEDVAGARGRRANTMSVSTSQSRSQ